MTIHHGKWKMFPAEVSSSCVSEQQHMDHCSCIHTLIYTANRAFKSQPHLEHPCFELPASVTPLVTDHSHREMSPKGFLVTPQLHLPVRPPKVPQGLRSNSCSDKHESLCNFYEGIRVSWNRLFKEPGKSQHCWRVGCSIPKGELMLQAADWTAVTHHTQKDSHEPGITKIYVPGQHSSDQTHRSTVSQRYWLQTSCS